MNYVLSFLFRSLKWFKKNITRAQKLFWGILYKMCFQWTTKRP
jgi:hypothetical protein